MGKVIRITESQLKKIIEKTINEDNPIRNTNSRITPKVGPVNISKGPGPGGLDINKKSKTIDLNGSIFENGIDKINTNSQEFSKAVSSIKNAIIDTIGSGGKGVQVTITGGASRVGEKQGYDNKRLAMRRANNFKNEIQKYFDKNVSFEVNPTPIIGGSDKKNSAEAKSAQKIQLTINYSKDDLSVRQAVSNTYIQKNLAGGGNTNVKTINEKMIKVCYTLPLSIYQNLKSQLGKYETK